MEIWLLLICSPKGIEVEATCYFLHGDKASRFMPDFHTEILKRDAELFALALLSTLFAQSMLYFSQTSDERDEDSLYDRLVFIFEDGREMGDRTMNRTTPEMRNLALWLLAQEAVNDAPPEEKMNETFRVCEKLRESLTTLVGAAGYRSLISRALVLGTKEAISLEDVQVKEDGTLGWIGALEIPQRIHEASNDGSVLVTQLLGLLVTFIGPALMLRLVREIWPGAPYENINSKTEKQL